VGELLAFITATVDEAIEQVPPRSLPTLSQADSALELLPPALADLRITKPARALAESLGLDLSALPTDRLVTEAIVREVAGKPAHFSNFQPANNSQILIYGAGGHAKTVLEMAQAIGAFRIAGIIDDNPALAGTSILGVAVLGTRELLPQLSAQGIHLAANGVGGIIDIGVRVRIFEHLAASGFAFPILRHPRATVEPNARLADGVQVFANAYVGSQAILHECSMVNTSAVVSHDCEIGAYAHIAPGALLAGHVHVGARALVGMGVTAIIGLKIGAGARIGNGAILLADVPDKAIVPAGKVWAG
jgi:sugar O-acyltransferase (sialic acid O-acetyltransferase NeuD family)